MASNYRLNVRFLVKLLLIVAVTCIGGYFLHSYQERRLTNRYLTQADRARDEGDHTREIEYLRQYYALNPENIDALVRFGMTATKHGTTWNQVQEGFFALLKALRSDPTLPAEVRLQCVRIALRPEVDAANEAKRNLEELYKTKPMGPDTEMLYVESLMRSGNEKQAEKLAAEIVARDKTRIEAYTMLALLKKRNSRGDLSGADDVIQSMLSYPANENNHKAWLRAAVFYRIFGPQEPLQARVAEYARRYAEAINRALELAPDDPEVLFRAAEHRLSNWKNSLPLNSRPVPTPEFDEGLGYLQKALAKVGPLVVPEPLPHYGTPELGQLELHVALIRSMASALILVERYPEAERYARDLADKFPNNLMLHMDLLSCLVRQQKYGEAEALCNRMAQANIVPAYVELQRGYMKFQQKKYAEAARHLERTVSELYAMPEEKRLAATRLAMCYEQTGEVDRAIEALKQSVPSSNLDPFWAATKIALAERMAQLGRLQEAIDIYKEVNEFGDARALAPMVNLMIRLRALAPNEALDRELDRLMAKLPEGAARQQLMAEIAQVRKQFDKAREQLDAARAADPNNPNLINARITLEIREKNYDEARKLLAEAEQRLGDAFAVRVMKVALLLAEAGGDSRIAPELESLAQGLEKFQLAERVFLLKQISIAARTIKRRDLARTLLERAKQERGEQDLELQYLLLDLALLDNDEPRILQVLDDIARISGGKDNHSYKLPQAFYLIHKAQNIKDDRSTDRRRLLEQAKDLLSGLENTRKEWGRLFLAQGRVSDLMGDRNAAISQYMKAVEQGERYPEVIGRLTQLCNLEGRRDVIKMLDAAYPEARAMLSGNPEVLIEALINNGDFAGAIERTREAVPESLNNAAKQAYAASVFLRCNQLQESENRIRRAHNLDPKDVDIWLALVQTLVQNNKVAEARELIERKENTFSSANAPLAVAMAHMYVDNLAKAGPMFETLLSTQGTDITVLRAAGSYYFNKERDYAKTITLMEKLLNHPQRTPQDLEVARRTMARSIVVTRDHRSGVRALGVLGFKSPTDAAKFSGSETVDELRCRFAVLFAIRGRAAREASVAVLREIERKASELTLDEQLAFGQLQYSLGDWTDARRRLLVAANRPDTNVVAIGLFANALLRKGELEDARRQIDRVIALDPNSQLAAELQARWLVLNNQPQEAVDVLTKFGRSRNGKPHVAAALLVGMGLEKEAESLYREAAQTDPRPEVKILYAHYLGRQGRIAESIEEFRKHWSNVRPEIACQLLCDAVSHADVTGSPQAIADARQWITDAVAKNPALKPVLAAFKSVTGQVQEAIELSREVLRENPQDYVTQNNLAFLLSLHANRHDEALSMIRKTIESVGTIPTLLDTEAVILIWAGKPNDAVERLQEVVVDEPGSLSYMHLAKAYLALGRIADAKLALREARRYNLRVEDFHPLERQAIRNAIEQLDR